MQTDEFLKRVRQRAGLKDDKDAQRAIAGVFGTLRSRISHAGGDNMAQQLPKEIRELWEGSLAEHILRSLKGVERMDLKRFVSHVQDAAHIGDVVEAEMITRAVFMTLREQISDGERFAIAAQLPLDIRELWQHPEAGMYGPEVVGPAAAEVFRSDEQIRREIEELIEVSDEIEADDIDVEVHQGRVKLTGRVRTDHERDETDRIAHEALGTTEVVNELAVEHIPV
jgi:uncharacterized protein (DUF2267 family)